jgi:hypothetical protein
MVASMLTTSVCGRRTRLRHLGPLKDDDDPMPAAPLHRSEPSTARAARPPLSGSGGGGDGDDFGTLAANDDDPMPAAPLHRSEPSTARTARPPLSGGGGGGDGDNFGALAANEDDPMPSIPPHRPDPSTARTARPPMSGGGGGVDGDDFGMWATNAPPRTRGPMPSVPPPVQPLDRTRHPSTYEWRRWRRRRRRLWCVGDECASTDSGPQRRGPFPHQSNPSTARAAHPPMSGDGGGVDGDDNFGV